jgi:ribosomal protein L37AE/L43A
MALGDMASAQMTRATPIDVPRGNPCAQCGRPISMPEWIEAGDRRACYLWHCHACDYRFAAEAYFDGATPDHESLAA